MLHLFLREEHSVQEKGSLDCFLYLVEMVDIYGSLKGKGLRVDAFLGTMVVEEMEVVRRTERQLLLQPLYLLADLLILRLSCFCSLLHLLLLGSKVTNLSHELRKPRLTCQFLVVIEEIGRNLSLVSISTCIHCNQAIA